MIAPDLREYVQMIRDGNAGSVLEQLGPVVTADPTHVAVHAVFAMANDAEGHIEEAVTAWRRAHSLIPDSPAVSEGLRRSLRRRLLSRIDARLEETARMLAASGEPASGETVGPVTTEAPVDEGVTTEAVDGHDPAPVDEVVTTEAVDAMADELAAEMIPPAEASASVAAEPEPAVQPEPAAEPPVPAPAAQEASGEGLDELIRELETARIVPDPTIRTIEASEIEPDVEDVVSETLARIYSNQRFYDEAARVYDRLAAQQPARAEEFSRKADEIRSRGKR